MRILHLVTVAILGALAGCYTLEPARGPVPQIGTDMAFDINDAGRAALGGSMGPEIGQIEGRLLDIDSGEYIVAVSAIKLLRGGEQVWRGERVRIQTGYVTSLYERRFSAGRSAAMGAAGLGALVAMVGRSIIGGGTPDRGPAPPDTGQTHRIPRP
jgi:hypothetical protein